MLAGIIATLGCAHNQYAFRRVFPPATRPATISRLRRDLVTARSVLAWTGATTELTES